MVIMVSRTSDNSDRQRQSIIFIWSSSMLMKNILLFMVITLSCCFCSCNTNRYIYSASSPNNPYFTKKGESKLTACYSTIGKSYSSLSNCDPSSESNRTGSSVGWDLLGGYAVTNHFSFIAGYYNKSEKDIYRHSGNFSPFNSSTVKYKRHLFETGGGYFVALNPKKTITFNFYAGVGGGKFSFEDHGIDTSNHSYGRYHSANITKLFLQPSFNFMPGNYVRFSFVLKRSFVHYGNIHTSYTAEELRDFSLDHIANQTLVFYEPAWNIQFGLPEYPWIKLDLTESVVTGEPFYTNSIRHMNLSIGLTVDFSKIKPKK